MCVFFSSRRRHTRYWRDWSSDVCSSDLGLLSTISVVMAVVLLIAAARSPRVTSTIMIVAGSLFLLSALVNLAVLRTSFNILAFEFENVVFSVVVGLLLLTLGAYGRIGGHLPEDSPYAHPHAVVEEEDDDLPSTPEDVAAEIGRAHV